MKSETVCGDRWILPWRSQRTRVALLYAQTHSDYFAHKNEQTNQIPHVKLAES